MYLDADLLFVLLDIGNFVGEDFAVFKCDSLGDAIHIGTRQGLVERHLVDFLFQVRGVRELLRKVAVVGEKQQPEAVLVQTAYGVDALRAGTFDQIHDGLAGMGVVERRDITLGLVEHEVDLLLALHAAVVEFHLVGGKHLGAQLGDDLAVDRDQARGDEIVGLAARAEARLCEETVQAHFADLLFGREFRVGRRFVVVLPRPRLIGFVAEFTVAVFLIPELAFAIGGLVAILAARFVAVAVLVAGLVAELAFAIGGLVTVLTARFVAVAVFVAGLVAEFAFAIGGLVTVLAARFVAVAVLVTGFIAGLTLAVSRFVAELAARFVECRAVVRREMGIVGGPPTGPLAGRLLRIGSITL